MIKSEYLPNRRICRIIGDKFDEIREHFSVKNPNAFFLKRFGNKFASNRIYCITPTGLFDTGMFYELLRYIKSSYPGEEIVYDDKIKIAIKPSLPNDATPYDSLTLKLRDYQLETVTQALQFGRGIIKVGTGGGKTLTIASLISTYHILNDKMKILLIVPDLTLVDQTFKDFNNYNVPFKITRWTGSIEPDLTSNVFIANIGILQSRFEDFPWLVDVDMLIVDECHKLRKANKVNKLITNIKTNHKFGLTGTLPDFKPDEWNIIGKLGSVFYEKSSYDLRIENYLTNAEIKIINIEYKDKVNYVQGTNKFKSELDFTYASSFRNKIISALCKMNNYNTLILVNHIAHGLELYNQLTLLLPGKKIYFIRGEVDVEDRAKVISEMEANDNIVCIAISAIFSTGVNIKNLHNIVFGSGGKSFIRIIQSIGRGLRLNVNKQKLTIYDITDKLKYSLSHSQKRKEIYTLEKINFTENNIVEK